MNLSSFAFYSMKNCEKSLIAKKDGVTTQSTSGTGENSIKRHASGYSNFAKKKNGNLILFYFLFYNLCMNTLGLKGDQIWLILNLK